MDLKTCFYFMFLIKRDSILLKVKFYLKYSFQSMKNIFTLREKSIVAMYKFHR